MAQKSLLMLSGTIVGQIVYYILLSYAWMLLGWKAHIGWVTIVVAYIVNPILCASLANHITSVQKKLNAVVVWLLLLCVVLSCAPLSNAIWLHASGYYSHAISNPNDYLGETIAWAQFLSSIEMVISGILFVVSFSAMKVQGKRRTLRD